MTTTRDTPREFTLTWTLDASPEVVFRSWTDPARLGWFFNDQQPVPEEPIELDLRVGGQWRQMMVIDEETSYVTGGVYREIVEPERVVFTFAWEQPDGSLEHELRTTVTFEAHGSKTRLTLRQGVFETTGRRDDHVTGWSSTLERLAEYLTTQGG